MRRCDTLAHAVRPFIITSIGAKNHSFLLRWYFFDFVTVHHVKSHGEMQALCRSSKTLPWKEHRVPHRTELSFLHLIGQWWHHLKIQSSVPRKYYAYFFASRQPLINTLRLEVSLGSLRKIPRLIHSFLKVRFHDACIRFQWMLHCTESSPMKWCTCTAGSSKAMLSSELLVPRGDIVLSLILL